MTKSARYDALVAARKACTRCIHKGFRNQSETPFDTNHLGNFSVWSHDLSAEVAIVAQDYANEEIFRRDKGRIEPKSVQEESMPGAYSTVTNYYLRQLTRELGYDIGLPTGSKANVGVFLTNAVLCLKPGSMSAAVPSACVSHCTAAFLAPLLEIIQPKAVITLGAAATKGVLHHYAGLAPALANIGGQPFQQIFAQGPYELPIGMMKLFPVYHPGRLGQNNRKKLAQDGRSGWELQVEDWRRIRAYLAAN